MSWPDGLASTARLPSGYRDYDEDAVGEIALVGWGQTLGFTLREIRDLRRLMARDRLQQRAAVKLGEIEGRLRALRSTRRQLEALIRCSCDGACPILRRARRPPLAHGGTMADVSFRHLPFAVKLAVGLTFFNSWVLFAEVVVDRHGLWRYMPGYKVGTLCPWDVAVAALIVAGVVYAIRRGKRTRSRPSS